MEFLFLLFVCPSSDSMRNNKMLSSLSAATRSRITTLVLLVLSSAVTGLHVTSAPEYAFAQQNESISIEDNQTSVAGPSPPRSVVPPETSPPSEEGIGSFQELENLTGENRAVIMNNTNIAAPNATTAEGMEKSQLGQGIPGEQGTILEGEIIENATK